MFSALVELGHWLSRAYDAHAGRGIIGGRKHARLLECRFSERSGSDLSLTALGSISGAYAGRDER